MEEKNARLKLIVTDGVFSMDGDIAPLDKISELADKYDALVFVDEAHATGFFGKTGRYENILHKYVYVYRCSHPMTVSLKRLRITEWCSCDTINPLKTEFLNKFIYKLSSYLTGNTLHLRYKAQPVNAV
jgi:hypothetical protein